ncbi:ADP-heptose--LPS heptosyltransferase 2 [Vibrio stylophorae]|uniref:ADP-heptose--LPS heptosyltransferase 2 n=1 Tax=Vibrio stylophorae TaxID=659351 RepID=A0ABM8ZWP7_9VIBR|nr:glycosyltransferase family 9 protein [Vibrio stylophorae]CAH0534684.1 ADP-heptose--LPS heptosyltransferase 2 [Vibrio stylophorae]
MKKVLVIRNDKIGDFMLAWPAFAMLKQSMPELEVTALVPGYTQALAQACPWIDHVLLDPTKNAEKSAIHALKTSIRDAQFDAVISIFSTGYNAKLIWRAGIPYRLAPATKLAQLAYNKRVVQRRSRSEKPEFEYNLDLIRRFVQDQGRTVVEPQAPYWQFTVSELQEQRKKLAQMLTLDSERPWIMVHAGTGGSANNLSMQQYAQLLDGLLEQQPQAQVVITAGPGEEVQATELAELMQYSAVIYAKNDGLVDFGRSLACAALFVAGSTGPLHMAAALNVPTVGFFPSKRSSTPLRWRPLNTTERHLAFTPPQDVQGADQANMALIDIDKVLTQLAHGFAADALK